LYSSSRKFGSLLSSESNDKPLVSVSFERFLDQKVQIPTLPENSHSCTSVGNEINMPIPSVSNIPCDQPAKIHPKDLNRYKPLKLPLVLHDIPPKIFKYIPLFNGEDDVTVERHMASFEHFTDCLDIQYEDVFMRLFTLSLVGEVKRWFRDLPLNLLLLGLTFMMFSCTNGLRGNLIINIFLSFMLQKEGMMKL
jgi:hypothetical protein